MDSILAQALAGVRREKEQNTERREIEEEGKVREPGGERLRAQAEHQVAFVLYWRDRRTYA